MYLPFAFVSITISFFLEQRVAGHIEEPLIFLDQGRTIMDYNANIITRVISPTIRQQYGNNTIYESVPIQEWLPTINHYSLRTWCSICFCNNQGFYNNQEFFIYRSFSASIRDQPWINLFGWVPSTWFDNFLGDFFWIPYFNVHRNGWYAWYE